MSYSNMTIQNPLHSVHARAVLLVLSLLLLSGCSSLPSDLKTSQEAEGIKDVQVMSNYQQWVGEPNTSTPVRLSGVIAKVSNLSDRTRLELVNLPITSSGKPDISKEASGRFVVYIDHFVEPMIYAPGRLLSVVGKSIGNETIEVGGTQLDVPAMLATGQHLWKVTQRLLEPFPRSHLFGCDSFECDDYFPSSSRIINQVQ
jgi:outer membrane lipoprotein